jgi:hypothetical protein
VVVCAAEIVSPTGLDAEPVKFGPPL